LINHALLEGEIVEGTHEKLVSREVFLKVNDIHEQNSGYGVPHKKEQDEVPLKVFIKCDACNQPFTGYVVKAKNLWYYKCRTTGCKCNKSAKTMHNLFADLLSQYEVSEEFAESLQLAMVDSYYEMTKENAAQHKILKLQLAEIEKTLDNIKEKYYGLNKMNEEGRL
jgi:hypothetical protein